MSKISIEKQVELIEQYMDEGNLCEANQVLRGLEARALKDQQKLSEYENGIPILKAKTDGTVYNYYVADEELWVHVEWAESIGWHYWDYYCDRAVIVHPERLHPLPSQTQEGS